MDNFFQQFIIHSGLLIIRMTDTPDKIMGYVTYDIDQTCWYWVHRDKTGPKYNTSIEAIQDLCLRWASNPTNKMMIGGQDGLINKDIEQIKKEYDG